MAVAHDGETNKTGQGAVLSGVDVTASAKTTAGSNGVGVLTVSHYSGLVNFTAGYPTWGGVAMTLAKDQQETDVLGVRASIFVTTTEPTTGASDVVFRFGDNVTSYVYEVSSYKDCDTASPVSASASAATAASAVASPATVTCTTAATEILVDCIAHYALDALTVGANQTQIVNLNEGVINGASSRQAGSDGGVMSWTYTTDSYWAIAAVSLKAGAAAPVVSNPIAPLERPFNMASGRR